MCTIRTTGKVETCWVSSPLCLIRFVINPKHWCLKSQSGFPCTHLHSHNQATGDVPHFVHHAIRAAAELGDLLQIISLHLEILPKQRRNHNKAENPMRDNWDNDKEQNISPHYLRVQLLMEGQKLLWKTDWVSLVSGTEMEGKHLTRVSSRWRAVILDCFLEVIGNWLHYNHSSQGRRHFLSLLLDTDWSRHTLIRRKGFWPELLKELRFHQCSPMASITSESQGRLFSVWLQTGRKKKTLPMENSAYLMTIR